MLTDIGMLLMVEKGRKMWKDYDKNKESTYLWYWDGKHLHGWTISQMLLVDGFK